MVEKLRIACSIPAVASAPAYLLVIFNNVEGIGHAYRLLRRVLMHLLVRSYYVSSLYNKSHQPFNVDHPGLYINCSVFQYYCPIKSEV